MTLTCGLEVTEGRWKWYHLKAWYGFLFAFRSNYGRICSRLWDIQCQRMAWPWKQVRGRSRSLKMAPFNRPYATFYWSAIVNIALSCNIFELMDVEYYCDLDLWVRGHWRSLKVGTIWKLGYGFLFAFHSNYGMRILAISEIFSVNEWRDLEKQVRVVEGHWKWCRSIDHMRLSIGLSL